MRAVAEGFRANPAFSAMGSLVHLGIGEALVGGHTASSPLHTRYDKAADRESAYEILLERTKQSTKA